MPLPRFDSRAQYTTACQAAAFTVEAMLAAGRWAAASFHAQQAAEKALKALFTEGVGVEPPRTHDLARLAEELQLKEPWLEGLDLLSRVYLVTRYPGGAADDEPPYGIAEEAAHEFGALAEKVVEWVQEAVRTESSSG